MTIARFALVAAVALGGLLAAGAAQAGSARADGDIAVRSGPGSSYRVVDRLEDGVSYEVVNCTSEARWCLVAEDGDRLAPHWRGGQDHGQPVRAAGEQAAVPVSLTALSARALAKASPPGRRLLLCWSTSDGDPAARSMKINAG